MRKKIGVALLLITFIGIMLLNPVGYYEEIKYRKALERIINSKLILSEVLKNDPIEVQEVVHLSGNVFQIKTADKYFLVSIEEKGSGISFEFYEYYNRARVSH